MEYFPIKSFRPVETKEEATDQDRTVVRLCEGLLPYPQGALSSGPEWRVLWGVDDLIDRAAVVLAGADPLKAHLLQLSRGNRTFLIVWSLLHVRALGFFEVVSDPGESDLDSTDVELTAPAGAVWRDKDPTALWYPSPLAGRWILGNGIDANLVWRNNALSVWGPAVPPVSLYDKAKVPFPPCTCFRQHVNRSIFAAGNADQPMRVWISEAPNAEHPLFEGINSLDTSYVDVHPHKDATRIVALSVYQQYVTVHTDRAPINLFGVNSTSDGFKCDQSASAANASAINPDCVGDVEGDASFYFGRDLEVYRDEAVRSGPFEKRGARDQEIATTQGAEVWNRDMVRALGSYGYHCLYDRQTRLFWIFARTIFSARTMLWVFNERTRTCAGPFHYPDAVVSTVLAGLILPASRPSGIGTMAVGSTLTVG